MAKLTLKEIKDLHDKAYVSGQFNREKASNDMLFYFITQWDEDILSETQLAYRGEFNVLKKAGRQIISDLASNPVEIDFEPINETRVDAAELADGIYRKSCSHNSSIEAFENAKQENIVCGFGAWEVVAEYVSTRSGNKDQVVARKPIYEANNTVFWDPNARYLDKSDAVYVSKLTAYSEDGYKALVKELTGEELETVNVESFKTPEQAHVFPWIVGKSKKIFVVSFYHRTLKKEKVLTMVDPFGMTTELAEASLEKVMDEMLDAGYKIESEKFIERWRVTKYIASGAEILDATEIAGEHIPIIPVYGEHAYVDGEEHYEGVTRIAKDPQRLRNFQLSYLADIASQSPRKQAIFFPEQIAGFEYMYSTTGIDNRYPYLLQNRTDRSGQDLPIGPVAEMPDQAVPSALSVSIEVSRQAIEDVANPGIPQDIADPDLSGKAVMALQSRLDMQSMVYQEHYKHGKRRDAEVCASMYPEIYDTPRKHNVELPDGTKKEINAITAVVDKDTGDVVFLNDLRNSEFDVISKIGPSFASKKDQTVDQIKDMIMMMDPGDPMKRALQLKQLVLMDGVEFDDIRDYANNELILAGVKKPETPEQVQLLKQAQENPKEDPNLVLAKAEQLKGQADIMREERENKVAVATLELKRDDQYIDVFKATTDRMKIQIDAQKTGATITKLDEESVGQQLENHAKVLSLIPKGAPNSSTKTETENYDFSGASDEELFELLRA